MDPAQPSVKITDAYTCQSTCSNADKTSDSVADEEYDEMIESLQLLFSGRHPPPVQSVKKLLDNTRPQRGKWLLGLVSIHCILDKYPCFKFSKWVNCNFSNFNRV